MTDKQQYTYTVLRYVHDVLTGEFVNVGLLMYVPERNWLKAETRTSIGRLKGVFPDLQRQAFTTAMRSVKRGATKLSASLAKQGMLKLEGNAHSVARELVSPDDSSLQWSPLGGGVTSNAEKTFDRVFERLVGRYDTHVPHRRTEDDVWRPVREKLAEMKLPVEFEEKVVRGTTDEIAFKHAWKNGAWHAYEPISFDLADADGIKEKARRWLGHLEAVHDGVSDDVKLSFVVGAPQNMVLMPAFENAIRILRKAAFRPKIYEESKISELVDHIADEVHAHRKPAVAKKTTQMMQTVRRTD